MHAVFGVFNSHIMNKWKCGVTKETWGRKLEWSLWEVYWVLLNNNFTFVNTPFEEQRQEHTQQSNILSLESVIFRKDCRKLYSGKRIRGNVSCWSITTCWRRWDFWFWEYLNSSLLLCDRMHVYMQPHERGSSRLLGSLWGWKMTRV